MSDVALQPEKTARPPSPSKPWTKTRIIGWALTALWAVLFIALIFWLVSAWNPNFLPIRAEIPDRLVGDREAGFSIPGAGSAPVISAGHGASLSKNRVIGSPTMLCTITFTARPCSPKPF